MDGHGSGAQSRATKKGKAMTYEEALQKAVKLLRLSQSSNPNEAALAAGKAQEIIDRYNIESVALDMASGDKPQPDEPIKDFGFDPLDAGTKKISTWSWRLFTVISRGNGCKGYLTRNKGGGIAIVGRPSDVQTVRYFYAWLKQEVERLAQRDCRARAEHGPTITGMGLSIRSRSALKPKRKKPKPPLPRRSLTPCQRASGALPLSGSITQSPKWPNVNSRPGHG